MQHCNEHAPQSHCKPQYYQHQTPTLLQNSNKISYQKYSKENETSVTMSIAVKKKLAKLVNLVKQQI